MKERKEKKRGGGGVGGSRFEAGWVGKRKKGGYT